MNWPKRWQRLVAALLCCVSCTPVPQTKQERWVVYYDKKLPAEAFEDYDLVVFDRIYHPKLKILKGKTILLAYVSAGELHGDDKKALSQLRVEKAVFKANEKWDSHVIDLTSATWRSMVMTQVADALKQGFDGVMLDTLDSPLYASAKLSPELGEANRQAAIQLISDIRQAHPRLKLMVNRALDVLPEVSGQLDFILCESILSETNVSTGQYALVSPNTYRQVADRLQDVAVQAPQLKIYSLDYWNLDDVDGTRLLYALQRENGFIPYVTTPDLRTLSPEPHNKKQN